MIKHLGIIMDGNRRFAKKLMLQPWKGHEWGAKKVHKTLEWAEEAGIKELTFYTFSIENFNRPLQEKKYLFDLMRKEFTTLQSPKKLSELKEKGVKINFIGRTHLLDKNLQESMKQLQEKTQKNNTFIVNFAIAYGGRQELLDAMNAMIQKIREGSIQEITEKTVQHYLYNASEPDLIIRTGGEKRTSNFLPWQSTYSEWSFIEKPWPAFEKEDFTKVLNEYNDRERRFGK